MLLPHWLKVLTGRLTRMLIARYGSIISTRSLFTRLIVSRPDPALSFERLEHRLLLAAPHPVDLAGLVGSLGFGVRGFRIDGLDAGDNLGYSVSTAGDVNADGLDDLIIGARFADATAGNTREGEVYVVFGRAIFSTPFDLSTLNGTNGFRIDGVDAFDNLGHAVKTAGDVNGDGVDDLIVGAPGANVDGGDREGETYVVFGQAQGFAAVVDLTTLDGQDGFRLDGIDQIDRSGLSVSKAGDVNGDGFGDIIIGAPYRDQPLSEDRGEAYVVFGRQSGFTAAIDLASLDGSNGFRLTGAGSGDEAGGAVSAAGDINGDGFDDILVGAEYGGTGGLAYVVLGRGTPFDAVLPLSLWGSELRAVSDDDHAGYSVSAAGDVNGDGFDDLIIGAKNFNTSPITQPGEAYVVFGKASGLAGTVNLSSLDGTNGFRIRGIDHGDASGTSVGGIGDFNGDGFDDVIVGAPFAKVGANYTAGETYVVFGKASGFPATFNLSSLDGTNGFRLDGIDQQDASGQSVSGAGDVNGDGFDDLIIGAPGAAGTAGEAYVVFGGNFTGGAETQVGGALDDTLTANQGAAARDVLIGGRGNDTLVSDGGPDILIGGSGADNLQLLDVNFSGNRRLDGGLGADTLSLGGNILHLDLTAIPDNRIQEIEVIDLTGTGNNALTLDVREVLNISDHSNTLTVLRDEGDIVNTGPGWTEIGREFIDGRFFQVLTQGAATLRIEDLSVTVNGNTAIFNGTPNADSIVYRVGSGQIRINGVIYALPSNIEMVQVDALGGNDVLNLIGTSANESGLVRPEAVFFEHDAAHAGFDFTAIDVETVILDGNGGTDTLTLRDPTTASDDKFFARPNSAVMFAADGSYQSNAFGFQTTGIFNAGNDLLRFFDSPGNDTLIASPGNSTFSGPGFSHSAQGFDVLVAVSLNGVDTASLTGTAGVDALLARAGVAVMSGAGFNFQLDSFEVVNANGLGASDLVRFFGSSGDDLLNANPTSASFVTGGFTINTTNIERLIATAGSGANDVAILTDSAGNDTFTGTVSVGTLLGAGFFEQTTNFDVIRIRGVNGGMNTRTLNNIAFTLIEQGTWV
ncbi:MAG: FG-GAP repeat protein [Planctomycetaceae bacterium]|nr:FG-GAP repeat protein [Planctomycetaceae bacterium]